MKSLFSKADMTIPGKLVVAQETLPLLRSKEHVVAIGGGHGLGRLLSSLSFLEEHLTGIVATTDNGGSTGRLRSETNCIACGDLRNCLNQLCAEPKLGRLLFEYRFTNSGTLSGHNLGNLMLLALDQLCARPLDAIELVRNLLEVKSEILPMAELPTSLVANMANAARVDGEVLINDISETPSNMSLEPAVSATPEVITALEHADLILIGPGSFLTSIMPPLLIPDVASAIANNNAPKIFIGNVGVENNITQHWQMQEQIDWMNKIIGQPVIDAILWPEHRENIACNGIEVITAPLQSESRPELHGQDELLSGLEKVLQHIG